MPNNEDPTDPAARVRAAMRGVEDAKQDHDPRFRPDSKRRAARELEAALQALAGRWDNDRERMETDINLPEIVEG